MVMNNTRALLLTKKSANSFFQQLMCLTVLERSGNHLDFGVERVETRRFKSFL